MSSSKANSVIIVKEQQEKCSMKQDKAVGGRSVIYYRLTDKGVTIGSLFSTKGFCGVPSPVPSHSPVITVLD